MSPTCRGTEAFRQVQCWGLSLIAWWESCRIESAGWRQSAVARCGAESYPWAELILPEVYWKRVAEEESLRGGWAELQFQSIQIEKAFLFNKMPWLRQAKKRNATALQQNATRNAAG